MKPRFSSISGPVLGLLIAAAVIPASTACDGFELQWMAFEDTVSLYSLARPEFIDRESAFDVYNRRPVVVDIPKPGNPADFDLAVSEQDGEFVFLPAGMFATFGITPGIAIDSSGASFEELEEAPNEGYTTDAPVPIRAGGLYTVRTRSVQGGCSRYGKLEVLEVDPQGIVEFRQVRNSLCNDRGLIPTSG